MMALQPTNLAGLLPGAVLGRGDTGYNEGRRERNARLERHPEFVVRCNSTVDVATAVGWAAANDVAVFVKDRGHSCAGNAGGPGGILLDLSGLGGIKVRAGERRATVQAGATWAQLDSATQRHGLATSGSMLSSACVAEAALSGGAGLLSRKFGHSLDNLLAAEMVTSQGQVVCASADVDPELFWGLRGAGHALGIVTTLQFALHEVGPHVLAGQVVYPFDDAERILEFVAGFMREAPDDLQCLPCAFRVPASSALPAVLRGRLVLSLVVFHADLGQACFAEPLGNIGGSLINTVRSMAYVAAQAMFEACHPAGTRYCSGAHGLADLGDSAIADFARFMRTSRGAHTVACFEPGGGAAGRIQPMATAMGGRAAGCGFHLVAGWDDAGDDEWVMDWARDFNNAMAAHAAGGDCRNLVAGDASAPVAPVFSDAGRVAALKRAWDPCSRLPANRDASPAPVAEALV